MASSCISMVVVVVVAAAAALRGAAAGEGPPFRLLQEELPQGGVHRGGLPQVGRQAEPRPHPGAHPHPLPRLLRPGLRRLPAPGQQHHQDLREGVRAQPALRPAAFEAINDIRDRLERACGRVVSRADIVALTARDSVRLAGGPWYKVPLGRRDGLSPAPQTDVQRAGAHGGSVQDQPGRDRPGGAVGRAHRGTRALRRLREPPVPGARLDDERVVLQPAAADLPGAGRRQHRGERRPDAGYVRQQVLRGPGEPGGAVHLRPGPLRQRHHQVRRRPGRLLRPVRVLVREDGDDPRAHRVAGTDPSQLRRAQPHLVCRRDSRRRR